jgi:Uma2 family endonuclease
MATMTQHGRTDAAGLRLFTVDEYDEMLRAGIFREGEPLELLGGRVVGKMPKSPGHMAATARTLQAAVRVLPEGWHAVTEHAVIISDFDEPEPDVIIRRGELSDYDLRKATPDDIALLVEVSSTSLRVDRGEKLRAYAAAGIPAYWIVNLGARCVEVYGEPRGGDEAGYGSRADRVEGEEVEVVVGGRVVGRVAVAALLPKAGGGDG